MKPTPDEWHTIYGALKIAAGQYWKDADNCNKDDLPRLREGFKQQARKCEALLAKLEQDGIQ